MKAIFSLLLLFYSFGEISSQTPISNIPYTQNDFDDLRFLKEELKNKNIICLGEEWHFTETFSQVKNRLVKYLHQELGYKVILFESSFHGAWIAEAQGLENKERLFETVQNIWRTESVLDLMAYISKSKKDDNPITQYGIDLYGTYTKEFKNKLAKYLNTHHPQLSKSILLIEDKVQEDYLVKHRSKRKFKSKITADDLQIYKSFLSLLSKNADAFKTQEEKKYYIRAIENRILLGESLISKDIYFREKVMADNIEWILNQIGKDEKVIIWAADIHISKSQKETVKDGDKSMIERLPKEIKDRVYSLSLIPVNSTPKKLRKELMAGKERFYFYPLSEDNDLRKRKNEFDGIIVCKSVESIEQYKVEENTTEKKN